MLEIEKRGFLTKAKYNKLIDFFTKNAEDLGQDDKDVVYYIYNDKLLKVVHNISKENAKISLKMNKIGEGSVFPETEIIFGEKEYSKLKFILNTITNPERIMSGVQKRRNFKYKECEFAIKWSKDWSYHFEVEKVVEDSSLVSSAEKDLENVANELGIKIMTEDELKIFTKTTEEKAEKNYRDLLLQKEKPKHQQNDEYSLNWIIANKPTFVDIDVILQKQLISKVLVLEPWKYFRENFYVSKGVVNCIHGKNHAIRVAIFMLFLTEQENINLPKSDIIYTGLIHDCSRVNDNEDEGHGERSALILDKFLDEFKLNIIDLSMVKQAIAKHDINYDQFEGETNYLKNKILTDLLKTADALDRYRFPRNDWWINERYLKLYPSDSIKDLAFKITTESENFILINSTNNYSIEKYFNRVFTL